MYNEFVLYKSRNFYYINSANVIDTFYNIRIDLDKLEISFELTRLLIKVTDENEDTSYILKLFLNTMYILGKNIKDNEYLDNEMCHLLGIDDTNDKNRII